MDNHGTDEESGLKCPRCGHAYAHAARFCDQCGVPLTSLLSCLRRDEIATARSSAATAHRPPDEDVDPRALRRPAASRLGGAHTDDRHGGRRSSGRCRPSTSRHAYTPAYLVEKILTTRSALEGERKLVTVLFVDHRGFLRVSAADRS